MIMDIITTTTHAMSIWMILLVTFDRYAAVCMPHQTQRRNLVKTKISVLFMSVSACLYASHFTVVYNYIIFSYKRPIYQFIIHFLFFFFGPMTVLVIMNVKIIYAVQAMRRRRTDMGVNNRDNVTLMIVTVVVVFIVCQLPLHLYRLMQILRYNNFFQIFHTPLLITFYIGQLFVCVNSSINFLIYCLLGQKFRLILVQMMSCN